jgi:hypothetical protein
VVLAVSICVLAAEIVLIREISVLEELLDEMERAGGRRGDRTGSGGDEGLGGTEMEVVLVVRVRTEARDGLGTRTGRGSLSRRLSVLLCPMLLAVVVVVGRLLLVLLLPATAMLSSGSMLGAN